MRTKYQYKSLGDTLRQMSAQIAESVSYADAFMPRSTNTLEMWSILKDNLVYKNDPPGIELLQSFPSLMEDNYWGEPGAGDCDCFTIAACACAVARGIPVRCVIVGNDPKAPSHIYCQMWEDGRWIDFDLVHSDYGFTKPYKYKQILKVH
jgi:hypothetical protein